MPGIDPTAEAATARSRVRPGVPWRAGKGDALPCSCRASQADLGASLASYFGVASERRTPAGCRSGDTSTPGRCSAERQGSGRIPEPTCDSRTRCAGARPSRMARRVSRGAGSPPSGAIPCRLRNPPSKHETGRPTADSPASGGGFVRCSSCRESEQTRGAGRPVAAESSRGSYGRLRPHAAPLRGREAAPSVGPTPEPRGVADSVRLKPRRRSSAA